MILNMYTINTWKASHNHWWYCHSTNWVIFVNSRKLEPNVMTEEKLDIESVKKTKLKIYKSTKLLHCTKREVHELFEMLAEMKWIKFSGKGKQSRQSPFVYHDHATSETNKNLYLHKLDTMDEIFYHCISVLPQCTASDISHNVAKFCFLQDKQLAT